MFIRIPFQAILDLYEFTSADDSASCVPIATTIVVICDTSDYMKNCKTASGVIHSHS